MGRKKLAAVREIATERGGFLRATLCNVNQPFLWRRGMKCSRLRRHDSSGLFEVKSRDAGSCGDEFDARLSVSLRSSVFRCHTSRKVTVASRPPVDERLF
jgi:hypothetical protein